MKCHLAKTLVAVLLTACALEAHAAPFNTARIDELTGLKGTLNEEEGVYKITFPRADVKVRVDGWQMPPFMGLGTWAAFKKSAQHEVMMMGDTVLFEDEVNPVMSVAFDRGLDVTALHNHFFFDEPKVYFMHISGEGSVEHIATAVRKVYDAIEEIRAGTPKPQRGFAGPPVPEKNAIDIAPLNEIFGVSGDAKDGMAKFVIGRTASMHGVEVGKEMGVTTWAAFGGTNEEAVVAGDFAVLEDELQRVLRALRKSGINIVAIHSHMTHEQPRMVFLHYWGRGAAKELAEGVRRALAVTAHGPRGGAKSQP